MQIGITRKNRQSIKVNVLLNILRTAMATLFPLLVFPYVARVLSPDGIGKVNYANTVISYFIILSSFGVPAYGLRKVSQYRDEIWQLKKTVVELFIINVIFVVLSYAVLGIVIILSPQLYQIRLLIIILSSSILFTSIGFEWVFTGLELYSYITVRTLIFQIISLVMIFMFVKNENDYFVYSIITVISSVGSNSLNYLYIQKRLLNVGGKFDIREINISRHWGGLFKFFIMALFGSILAKFENIFLGLGANYSTVGVFSSVYKILTVVIGMLNSINTVFVSRLSYYSSSKLDGEYQKMLNNSFSLLITIAIPSIVGLDILGYDIINLMLGAQYATNMSMYYLLTPSILFSLLSFFFANQVLYPFEKDNLILFGTIFNSVLSFIFDLLFIPRFQNTGASIAILLSSSLSAVFYFFLAKKQTKIKGIFVCLLQVLFASLIMGLVVFAGINLPINRGLKIVTCVLTGAITYFFVLTIVGQKIVISLISSLRLGRKN